ncbi:phage tail protein [Paenibacillus hamazuiensis]|uniref:phage tail protein n=1 Tax=Paenibacillus hamazuiensis TaxID=2936508 RepID=UPI00200FB75D|nr:tail fiber protein [Paenibacillus hamazuiensis]
MSDPFVGEIRMFAGTYAPRGWAFCNGQLLPISQNTALFSLLGTNYGGNGTTTFALPDLQGRVPIHAGQGSGPGLTPRTVGEKGGAAAVTLMTSQLPAHSHAMNCSSETGASSGPGEGIWAVPQGRRAPAAYTSDTSSLKSMGAQALSTAGGNQPHNNMQPYLAVNFIIALEGIFPQRP